MADIGALNPPSSVADQVGQFVSLLNTYSDQLDALASRTRTGENYESLLSRSTSQVNALNHLSDQANTIAAKLKFNDCAT